MREIKSPKKRIRLIDTSTNKHHQNAFGSWSTCKKYISINNIATEKKTNFLLFFQ